MLSTDCHFAIVEGFLVHNTDLVCGSQHSLVLELTQAVGIFNFALAPALSLAAFCDPYVCFEFPSAYLAAAFWMYR